MRLELRLYSIILYSRTLPDKVLAAPRGQESDATWVFHSELINFCCVLGLWCTIIGFCVQSKAHVCSSGCALMQLLEQIEQLSSDTIEILEKAEEFGTVTYELRIAVPCNSS